jgi:hypothetical protein
MASHSHATFGGCFSIKNKEINLVIPAARFAIDIET